MASNLNLAVLSLILVVAGLLLGAAVGVVGNLNGRNWVMLGLLTFAAIEVAAIVLGVLSKERLGRGSAIAVGCLLVVSLGMVG